jgi:flagellar biosynthesis protein FliR
MYELIPVVLAAFLGARIWGSRGGARLVRCVLAVLVTAAIATVVSGEYRDSWMFIVLDFGEAALGLAFGFVIAHRRSRARERRDRDTQQSLTT